MLEKLLADVSALTAHLPPVQSAVAAVQAAAANPESLNISALQASANDLQSSLVALVGDLVAVTADLAALPEASRAQAAIDWSKLLALLLPIILQILPLLFPPAPTPAGKAVK